MASPKVLCVTYRGDERIVTNGPPGVNAVSENRKATIVQDPPPRLELCQVCQSSFGGCLEYARWYESTRFQHVVTAVDVGSVYLDHHSTYETWQAAIHGGCSICTLLQGLFPPHFHREDIRRQAVEPNGLFRVLSTSPPDECYNLRFIPSLKSDQLPHQIRRPPELEYDFRRSKDSDPRTVIIEADNSTHSPHSLICAKNWLELCQQRHSTCAGTTTTKPWYPTRLLEIDFNRRNDTYAVKLIQTAKVHPSGPYVTLSHCWGKANLMRTLQHNIESFEQHIPSLPRTFQDAVKVTIELGLRYLWIDSLCIVQDDLSDWARESSLMSAVYKNGHVNLAAADSSDGDGGLFRQRSSPLLSSMQVDVSWREGGTPKRYQVIDRNLLQREVDDGPLQQRAWVLQERILSPRTLHFGRRQLFWECNEITACETFPSGFSEISKDATLKRIIRDPTTSPNNELNSSYVIWGSILNNYFGRSLTYQSDRLPALSGLAEYLAPTLGGSYLAGIWNNDSAALQLSWFVDLRDGGVLLPRASGSNIPTWSWASVENTVSTTMPEATCHAVMRVVEGNTTPLLANNTMGAVSDGFLVVKGPLNRVTVRPGGAYLEELDLTLSVKFDIAFAKPPENLYILLLYTYDEIDYSTDREYGDIREFYVYLLLEPSVSSMQGKGGGIYHRCGLATASHNSAEHNAGSCPPSAVINGHDADCEEFKDGIHQIRII